MSDAPLRTSPCVGSGTCCRKVPCGYGEWNDDKTQCRYLEASYTATDALDGKPTTLYRCGHYDYISKQPGAEFMPAFGAGCCMSLFNENRQRIIRILLQRDKGALEMLRPNLKQV